jgi:hypothetical protein
MKPSSSSASPFLSRPAGALEEDISAPYLNPIMQKQLDALLRKHYKAVFHVCPAAPGKRGSGIMAGPTLFLSCHHVLPTVDAVRGSRVFGFYADPESSEGKTTVPILHEIVLDPDACFITSPNHMTVKNGKRVPLEADKDHLDITFIGVKPGAFVASIQDAVFDIFESFHPNPGDFVCAMGCPEDVDPHTILKGALRFGYGGVRKILPISQNPTTFKHTARTHGGSSGGPIVIPEGLVGIHHQAEEWGLKPAVLASAIVRFLEGLPPEQLEKLNRCRAPLPPVFGSVFAGRSIASHGKINNLPKMNQPFIGRFRELDDLHQLCSNNRIVAVTGFGGIGKTTFIAEYINRYGQHYQLVHFIRASTPAQLEQGLVILADELNIPVNKVEIRLNLLKMKLEQEGTGKCLIVDGMDNRSTLTLLRRYLPDGGGAQILMTSRLSVVQEVFAVLPLNVFSSKEAIEFLKAAIPGKEHHEGHAALLAVKLGYLPLALSHAAAFIRRSPRYTVDGYAKDFDRLGLKLQKSGVHFDVGEETVLNTWTRSIDEIIEVHQCSLAKEILDFLSVLGEASIPLTLVDLQFCHRESFEIEEALALLGGYSLLQISSDSCSVHSLLQKVIREQLSSGMLQEYYLEAFEVFTTLLKEGDLAKLAARRDLDSYIPHMETVVTSIEKNMFVDAVSMHFLLRKIWKYYHEDGKYKTAADWEKFDLGI